MVPETALAPVNLGDINFLGRDLVRPECVLAGASGNLYVADWRGGVMIIEPSGAQTLITAASGAPAHGIKPNGIALTRSGSFLVTHLDNEAGGVFQLSKEGALTPLLLEIDGRPLPPTNFVHIDAANRVWITLSTRMIPRTRAQAPGIDDGFIILLEDGRARIVADGLGYTNEAKVDPSGNWLYVNETFGRRLSRFAIKAGGNLGDRETVTDFGPGTFPDGLEFDAEGGVWITSIFSNRLIRIRPNGSQQLLLEDCDGDFLTNLERDFQAGVMESRPVLPVPGQRLHNISSLAFGGPDLKTVFLGCLQGSQIATFPTTIAGAPPVHWQYA